MKELLKMARNCLVYLEDAWDLVLKKLNLDRSKFNIFLGMAVPSSSPRGLLIRHLIYHPSSQAEMASAGIRPFLGKMSSLDKNISYFRNWHVWKWPLKIWRVKYLLIIFLYTVNIGRFAGLSSLPLAEGKEFVVRELVADGNLTMFFICCHGSNGNNAI